MHTQQKEDILPLTTVKSHPPDGKPCYLQIDVHDTGIGNDFIYDLYLP